MKLPLSGCGNGSIFPGMRRNWRAAYASGFEVEGSSLPRRRSPAWWWPRSSRIAPHPEADKLRICQVERRRQRRCRSSAAQPMRGRHEGAAGARWARCCRATCRSRPRSCAASNPPACCARRRNSVSRRLRRGLLELPADAPVGAACASTSTLDDAVLELKVYAESRRCDVGAGRGARGRGADRRQRSKPRRAASVRAAAQRSPPARWCTRRRGRAALADHARISGLEQPRHDAAVDAGAAAPRRPAQHQPGRRRHELRDARTGQPMHAYDCAAHRRARCRCAWHARGETLQLLDERSVELDADVLLIADDSGPIGLAGVMGGQGTSITADATDVLLEVAYFAPDAIAGRARRYGLQTDASQRFERGVDPQGAGRRDGARHGIAAAAVRWRGRPVAEVVDAASLPAASAGAAAPCAAGTAHRRGHLPDARVERSLQRAGHAGRSRTPRAGRSRRRPGASIFPSRRT